MTKYIYIISIFLCFSCNGDDKPQEKGPKLVERMEGRYSLAELYTETPVDLNFDDEYKTNLLKEIDCLPWPFGLFDATVEYNPLYGGYQTMSLDLAHSDVSSDVEPYSQCFFKLSMPYNFEVDEDTGEIIITWRFEERESQYGILTDVDWADDVLHYQFDKIFFTSEGWQTVKLHAIYEKDN